MNRSLTLDHWVRPSREQDDRFLEVQVNTRGSKRWGPDMERLKDAAMRLARENGKVEAYRVDMVGKKRPRAVTRFRGGFAAPEMVEEAGLEGRVPGWLPGAVCGWLSGVGVIQVGCNGMARENSSNGSRKGGKIARWELAERAIVTVPGADRA